MSRLTAVQKCTLSRPKKVFL